VVAVEVLNRVCVSMRVCRRLDLLSDVRVEPAIRPQVDSLRSPDAMA
jgi:hypothetical protein